MADTSDRVRVVLVAVTAVLQALAVPLTTRALGPSSDTSAISAANHTPITPADFSFFVWGLIYVGSIAVAIYQLLPSQHARPVHRRTGWWLTGAFTANTVSVLIFGAQAVWLAQILLVILVICLVFAARGFLVARAGAERCGRDLAAATRDDLSRLGDPGDGRGLCDAVPLVGYARLGTVGQ